MIRRLARAVDFLTSADWAWRALWTWGPSRAPAAFLVAVSVCTLTGAAALWCPAVPVADRAMPHEIERRPVSMPVRRTVGSALFVLAAGCSVAAWRCRPRADLVEASCSESADGE